MKQLLKAEEDKTSALTARNGELVTALYCAQCLLNRSSEILDQIGDGSCRHPDNKTLGQRAYALLQDIGCFDAQTLKQALLRASGEAKGDQK